MNVRTRAEIGELHDEIYRADVLADPYAYYGRLREVDPLHWNAEHSSGS